MFSQARRELLIKFVAQSIPLYCMNAFLMPKTLANEIEKMINSFWWGSKNGNKGIKWTQWEKLTMRKEYIDLGL